MSYMNACVYVAEPPMGKWEKWENGHSVREKIWKVGHFVFSLILHDGIMGKAYKMHELICNEISFPLQFYKNNNGEKYGYPRRDKKHDE